MKRKIYRSSAMVLLGSFFLFGLGGCSSILNFSSWSPFGNREEDYFAAKKSRQDTQAIYKLACAYQANNQHQMALEQFKRVLQLEPNNAQSYNGMGISYDRLGNYRRALGCYSAALKINPDLDYVHNNMGYSYLLQGDTAQAAAAFQKAIALNKTNDRYRNNLGVAYAQMGKINLALAEFKSTEKDAAAPASTASEKLEGGEITNQQTEEKAPAMPEALTDNMPTAQAKMKTVTLPTPSLPIKTTPLPVQPAAVEAIPLATKAVPAQPAADSPVMQIATTAKPTALPATPVMEESLTATVHSRQPEKMMALEPLSGSITSPPQNTILTQPDPTPSQATTTLPQVQKTPAQLTPAQQMLVTHNHLIEVANGSGSKDAANWWGSHLRSQGLAVVQFTTESSSNYAKTKIYYCEGYLQEAYQLAKKIPLFQEFQRVAALEGSNAKIRVVIGRDVLRFAHKKAEKIIVARAGL